tara:strand:- start:785 stop:1702 length:918 start_codon:yes stop_codon:yes gene_type:complete
MKYNRIMPGAKSVHFNDCLNGGFIGVDFGFSEDLSNYILEDFRSFTIKYRPIYLKDRPEKTKVAAGLACGSVWTVCSDLQKGDIVLCPDGLGEYLVGEIISNYYYVEGDVLPHRRKVSWFKSPIKRSEMSKSLQNSSGSVLTTCNITKYADELESLIKGEKLDLVSNDPTVEDASEFALEKHLEDFLINNWNSTSLGKKYDIYEEDGEIIGQQYKSDTGYIDILAISKDKKTLLVVELKKGRVSDTVVGQIQRYMGFVKSELAEENQDVKGVIIGHDDDLRIHRALSVANNIEFYKYKVNFNLYQ